MVAERRRLDGLLVGSVCLATSSESLETISGPDNYGFGRSGLAAGAGQQDSDLAAFKERHLKDI